MSKSFTKWQKKKKKIISKHRPHPIKKPKSKTKK